MDTKERKRPASRKTARPMTAKNRRSAAAAATRKRHTNSRPNQPRRVVRPPREDVPRVVYTMPKPFSRGGFLLRLISVAAVVAAVLMCLSLFFRVEQVLVSGAEKYTPYNILEASGIAEGDSLLSVRDTRVAGKIKLALPYVDEVRVGIKLPGTVQIEITEFPMTYAIRATDSTWWLITSDGRIVDQIPPTAASGYTRVLGVEADGPRKDQQVTAAEPNRPTEAPAETDPTETGPTLPTTQAQITGAQRLQVLLTVLDSLEDSGIIGQVESIDVTNLNNITMEYAQRLSIILGTQENLPYKIAYMAQAISQLPDYETGELDVSFKYSEKALLNPRQ